MLHSTFWIHGAGELDLPPLWVALTGDYDTTGEVNIKETRSLGTGASSSGFLLDFLYPSGAFTFLRQFSGWPLAWQGSNNRNAQSTRARYRLFSSGPAATTLAGSQPTASEDTYILDTEDSPVSEDDSSGTESRDAQGQDEFGRSPATLSLLRLLKSKTGNSGYENAWKQYNQLPTEQASFVIPALFKYVSNSEDPLFVERSITLFNMIPDEEKDSTTWRNGTKLFVAMGKLAKAFQIHQAALKHKHWSASVVLISAQLKNSQWKEANRAYTAHMDVFPHSKYQLDETEDGGFTKTMANPLMLELSTYMLDLPKHVLHMVESLKLKRQFTAEMKHFAIGLAYHALNPRAGLLNGKGFLEMLQLLRTLKADTLPMYRYLMWTLHEKKHTGLMIYVYNVFRERHRRELPRIVLYYMVEIFCDLHDVQGIQQVLNDFFYCFDGPDIYTYRKLLWEFAWQGDAATVEALFEQYTAKFYRGVDSTVSFESAIELTPLLNVYAKRGELSRVISLFEDISSKYKLEPNLECWNILINAYGKVHDIDGAFETFEQLLESPLQPDCITFGTMMGICVRRGDRERTLELFQLATNMGIPISTSMMDCLVLAHIRDDKIEEAQELCEKALSMELIYPPRTKSPRTNMWNQLLLAFAFRGDLEKIRSTLHRMQKLKIEYDQYTYSALMASLSMLRLANRTWRLLTKIMPRAGVPTNSFHYALVMGACLTTGELDLLFAAYDHMLSRNIKPNASTSLLALKANAELDQRRLRLDKTTEGARLKLAEEYFDQVILHPDAGHLNPSIPQKGPGREPVDIAYSTSMFQYMIHVYGPYRAMDRVQQLYEDYYEALPEHRKNQTPPIRMLEALMDANVQTEKYEVVEQCWSIAFDNAKKEAAEIGGGNAESGAFEALRYHKFSLSVCLSSYIVAMDRIRRPDKLMRVIDELQEAGFALDNKNHNLYIQSLVRLGRVKEAFLLCETRLMINWPGWKKLRQFHPEMKGKLSLELRTLRKTQGHLRPLHYTLLVLARGWLDANEAAAEDQNAKAIVDELENTCPKLVSAIQLMPRTNDPVEIHVLTGEGW